MLTAQAAAALACGSIVATSCFSAVASMQDSIEAASTNALHLLVKPMVISNVKSKCFAIDAVVDNDYAAGAISCLVSGIYHVGLL